MASVIEAVEQVLSAVKAAYQGWESLDDPGFIKEELTYKRNAVEKARQLLSREESSRLLAQGDFEEIRSRLKIVANGTNLLYRSQPLNSDVAILFQSESEFSEIAREIYDLLYGEGDSAERLEKFIAFETAHGYKATWPFPTYLLFLLNPGSDFFVKPTVVQWLLEASGASFQYSSKPSGEFYRSLLGLLEELRGALAEKGTVCSDMVDLQSLVWVAHNQNKQKAENREFLGLWGQFRKEYLEMEKGRSHVEQNLKAREAARAAYQKALNEEKAGTSITETVIRGFLPYRDTKTNAEAGYWCSPPWVFNADVRAFFASKGWNWDWDAFAKDLFDFVRDSVKNPDSLEENSRRFLGKGYKGLQAASLSPILNALAPENFLVVNLKSLKTLERFGKKSHAQTIEEYARTNEDLFTLYRDWEDLGLLESLDTAILPWTDYFDIFCHWLMAEKNYFDTKFWKIAPGKNAKYWDEWKEKSIIAVGWSDFGDLSSVKKKEEFDRVAEEYLKRHPEDTKIGVSQVWRFISSISIGDRVVANEGTRKILGIGTVTGKYRYEPDLLYSHVIPVTWDDLCYRKTDETAWVKTLIELPREKFENLEKLPSTPPEPTKRVNKVEKRLRSYYPEEEDLRRACNLFADAVEKADVENPSSWCATFLKDRIRLNVGRAATIDCLPGSLRISVIEEEVPGEVREEWKEYENPLFVFRSIQEKTIGYDLPSAVLKTHESLLGELTGSFISKAAKAVEISPYGAFHEPEIVDFLSEFLHRDLPSHPKFTYSPQAEISFNIRAFKLLQMLQERPEVGVYLEHTGEFQKEVETPVKGILERVASSMKEETKRILETEKDLFSRIPKSENPEGPANPFFGGSFYLKGNSREEGFQLYILLTSEGLKAGLSFKGKRTSEQTRFGVNLEKHGAELNKLLPSWWETPALVLEEKEREPEAAMGFLARWVSNPDQMGGDNLSRFWEREHLIEMDHEVLVKEVQTLFNDLFPFILLGLEDDPMPRIREWIGLDPVIQQVQTLPIYSLQEIADRTGYPLADLGKWKRSLERKKQAVFYGPPGTGKTFIAREMARHLVGGGKGSFEVVQFHPSYAYEDFIEGIRPAVRGEADLVYEVKPGTFLEFCRKAEVAEGDPCVLIVDEINRAPLSRVFGELMYLLEYRGETVNLASGRRFSIPENVFLIGTMNTADRSIALVDHALRRRFAFISLFPRFGVLAHYHERQKTGFYLEGLVEMLEKLNKAIGDPNFSIGVSFFMRQNLADELEDIWRMEIEPYLEEYFYEKNGMVDDFRWEKIESVIFPKVP